MSNSVYQDNYNLYPVSTELLHTSYNKKTYFYSRNPNASLVWQAMHLTINAAPPTVLLSQSVRRDDVALHPPVPRTSRIY